MDEQREWPIYALANYENSGRLLDLCRAHLRPADAPQTDARRRHDGPNGLRVTTSGYLTTEEAAGAPAEQPARAQTQLEWRHLLQVPAPPGSSAADPLERQYQVQVGELGARVRELLRPLDADQAARLRRLSWRKRRQLKRASQTDRPGAAHAKTSGRAPQRHLASNPGQTFSLDQPTGQLAGGHDQSATRLERWLPVRRRAANLAAHAGQTGDSRGRYGESIVHVLLIEHTNEHLVLLLLLLHFWPGLLFDVFESHKFRHLNALHLAISRDNAHLLAHLIALAQKHDAARAHLLIEQHVSGSLFRPPPLAETGDPTAEADSAASGGFWRLNKVSHGSPGSAAAPTFWCDRLAHWPTTEGARHRILFDRLKSRAPPRAADRGEQAANSITSALYFGQTPLGWSVSFRSRPMFELLARAGAQVNSTDCAGNNGLHQLVINNQPGWTRALIKQRVSRAARNSLGLTPFLLACHLGRCELFAELLELSAVEFWCYSSVRCCGYPLASLDSILQLAGRPGGQQKSAVSVILESRRTTNEQKSALLSTGVVKKLLEEKWNCFARRLFYRDLLVQLLQLLLMIAASLLRPARVQLANIDRQQQQQWPPASSAAESEWWRKLAELARALSSSSGRRQTLLRHLLELASLAIGVGRLWSFGAEWLRHRNLALQLTYNPLAANQALGNALLLACLPLRLLRFGLASSAAAGAPLLLLDQLEDVLLIVASPLLWSSLLFFVAAFYVTGPFVAMINYMLTRDLRQFSLIYLIFLYAFAQCIFFINHQPGGPVARSRPASVANDTTGPPAPANAGPTSELEAIASWLGSLSLAYVELWLELFKMTLGVYEFQPFRHSILSRLLLMLFMHLIPILFNMLIAMMNNTYSLIISQSERAWSFQWAKTLFALERRLNDDQRLFYLKKYAINLSSSIKSTGEAGEASELEEGAEVEDLFVPGLMIIKRTHCTRAEMRRRLIGFWQKSIRQVLGALKSKQCANRTPPS